MDPRISQISLAIVLLLGLAGFALAQPQPPPILWTHTYGDTGRDGSTSVQWTVDGGYIIAGYTTSFGAGDYDVYLIKTDASGDTSWTRTFGGDSADLGLSAQQTTDTGFVVAGYTNSFGAGGHDVYLIKTDANGDCTWTHTYGWLNDDYGAGVQQTTDGGYIIVGTTFLSSTDCDVLLIKTDSAGNLIWLRNYGGNSLEYGNSVQQTFDGGYIIAGWTRSYGAGIDDLYLIKTEADGDTIWTHTYGGSSGDYGAFVQQTTDSGYVITGNTQPIPGASIDVYLVKTNSNGNTIWTHTFGGDSSDFGACVRQTRDGGYVIAGSTNATNEGLYDFYLIKTDTNGVAVWESILGGSQDDRGSSVVATSDTTYTIAGSTSSNGAGGMDVWLIRLGYPSAVLDNPLTAIPLGFKLFPPSPNPFNASTTIPFTLPVRSHVELSVYDLAGRRVAVLADDWMNPGSYQATFDATGLPSGMYLAKIEAGNYTETQKIVLLK